MKSLRTYFLGLASTALMAFCVACDPAPTNPLPDIIPTVNRNVILIGNEGMFQHGDASLTLIDIKNNKTIADIFKQVNGRSLGDVLQSIYRRNNELYLVVNNSSKIEVVNATDYSSILTINGFTSPRFIAFYDEHTAFVSEFYSNELKIIDPTTHLITGSITCPGWQEELAISGNLLYITGYQSNQIYICNLSSKQIIDSFAVGKNPVSLQVDNLHRIWIGCNGNGNKDASVKCYDALMDSVVYTFPLYSDVLRRLGITKDKSQIIAISDDVWISSESTSAFSFSKLLLYLGAGHSYYGVGTDPYSGDLYISDALDFQRQSDIIHLDSMMNYMGQFKAGIGTSSFLFIRD